MNSTLSIHLRALIFHISLLHMSLHNWFPQKCPQNQKILDNRNELFSSIQIFKKYKKDDQLKFIMGKKALAYVTRVR